MLCKGGPNEPFNLMVPNIGGGGCLVAPSFPLFKKVQESLYLNCIFMLFNLWCDLVCKNFSVPIEMLLYFYNMNYMFGNNINNYEEYEEYSNSCQEDCEILFKPFLNVSILHNPFNLCKIFTIFNFFNDYKYDCKVLSRICYNYAYVQLI
jgi:hypothetical protein